MYIYIYIFENLVLKPNKENTVRINSELGDLMVIDAHAKKDGWYSAVLNHKLGNVQVMYQDSDIWTPAVISGAKELTHVTLHVGMILYSLLFHILSYTY
jgi:hypothetical protein